MKRLMLLLALLLHHSIAYPSVQSDSNSNDDNSKLINENSNESSKKVIGSSVVTSVSVILNGAEPQFTDAVGQRIPKPQAPLQVASPINLLNPDRYEFYTFDSNGELVKRIMTLQEIHSIVANGDGDGGATVIHNTAIDDRDPDKNVQDIVASVQNVLTKEVEWKKNSSNFGINQHQMLDTPDVSSSWSMILPAIFGNTGGEIFSSNNRPQQVVMTPDSDVVEHITKPNTRRTQKPTRPTTTTNPPDTRTNENDFVTTMYPTSPQKIFVNNKEIIKPLFNRNDAKVDGNEEILENTTIKLTTTTKIKPVTTKRPQKTKSTKRTSTTQTQSDTATELTTNRITTQKRKPTTSSSSSAAIPTKNVSSTSSSAPTSTKKVIQQTKRIQNKNKTTTPKSPSTTTPLPSSTIKHKIQKKKPSTTSIGTTKSTRKPSTTPETKVTSSTTVKVETTEINKNIVELPLSKMSGQLVSSSTTTSTENPNKLIVSEIISSSTSPATIDLIKEKDSTTAAFNSILNSLLESSPNNNNDDDMNTKLSFDQIMESLKDKEANNENNIKKNVTAQMPILYNNNDLLKPMDRIKLKPKPKPALETIDETTMTSENYEKFEFTTLPSSNLESIEIDNASVVKFDPLYAELLDPILTQLTTTENLENTDLLNDNIQTTTVMPVENKENYYNILLDDTIMENTIKKTNYPINNNHSSLLTQKIEEIIAQNNNKNDEKVYIKLESPEIKNFIEQNIEMNMKDLQKEIATVASMLEDNNNIHSTTINPNKLITNSDDEIQALLSDVYNQITNTPLISSPEKLSSVTETQDDTLKYNSNSNIDSNVDDSNETSNRFTNLAQISSSILLPPNDRTQELNSNDKFNLLETLALKLNDTNNQDNNNSNDEIDSLLIDHFNKINLNNQTDENSNVIAQKNNLTNSNSMNLNENANAIELNSIITTTDTILPILFDTQKFDNMNIDDENVSSPTEYITNETENDNIFDSTTNNVKVIESLIKTTVQPLIENNNIKSTTESSEKLTTILYKNSEIVSINDDKNLMEMYKNNENENISSDDMSTTIEIDTEKNKFDEITENSSEKSIEITKNDNNLPENFDLTTPITINDNMNDETEANTESSSTEMEMELVKLITKPTTQLTEKPFMYTKPTESSDNITETEHIYIKLGESSTEKSQKLSTTSMSPTTEENVTIRLTIIPQAPSAATKKKPTLKPVHYFKQPISQTDQKLMTFNSNQQRPVIRPAALTNLKITQISTATRSPVKLEPSPEQSLGLEASTLDLQEDVQEFARLCNELAFNYWRSITAEKISNARSLVLSPFALTSMLSMVFLGARGSTSGEMNEILRLDDMVTFNPHLVFKNITESVEHAKDSEIASSAFVREIFSDRTNGKILPFFKEKVQQIYSGHVEEVNFNVVNDIIRRRTNLLIKRHTGGKVMEYLRTNSVWVNGPLSTVTANLFQTNCSRGSINERDGEMFFQVHPSIRQRRLVPIPAVLWRSGFTAGYDPELDATAVAFGSSDETVSTIYVMPGQHGLAAPGDNLERLERNIMENGISKNVWSHLLTSLMQRPGLEIQLPRFSHRSFVNASIGLQKLGLKALFNSDNADLGGLTGQSKKDIFLSDMIQINTFSTCGEEKISDHHHVEMYPAPPLRKRNSDIGENDSDYLMDIEQIDFGSIVNNPIGRGFYDDLLDPKYLELPLPLRPRQARIPDAPRLRFDKPFLYFVRHNPTGMILFMGRFNPRLLP